MSFAILIVILTGAVSSCSKEAGEGGNSSIYGKVLVKNYNSTFTLLKEEYYAQDEDVYIIYGDDRTYSDRVRTSYDGSFEFKNLRSGEYHIYCYSKDSSFLTNALIPVIRDVTIESPKQSVEVPLITLIK